MNKSYFIFLALTLFASPTFATSAQFDSKNACLRVMQVYENKASELGLDAIQHNDMQRSLGFARDKATFIL